MTDSFSQAFLIPCLGCQYDIIYTSSFLLSLLLILIYSTSFCVLLYLISQFLTPLFILSHKKPHFLLLFNWVLLLQNQVTPFTATDLPNAAIHTPLTRH